MMRRWLKTDLKAAADAVPVHPGATAAMSPADFQALQKKAAHATVLLKSMANETRLLILCQLALGEKSVSELLKCIPLSQSALSQHLAVLRRENLVATRREAQSVVYSLASDEVTWIMTSLYDLFCRDKGT
jgi:DNA-binding transcriptional ArsR family regulator